MSEQHFARSPSLTALTPPTVARYGGRFLTRGDEVITAEGTEFTERIVLIEFPNRAAAMEWHNDADYQSASAFRRAASTSRMILQEGHENTSDPDPQI